MPDETKSPRSRARKSPLPPVPTGPGAPVAVQPSPTSTSQPLRVAWTGGAPAKTTVRQIPQFDPAQYLPNDLTTASSSLSVTSEADHQQHMQTIDGQNRTVDVMIANLKLRKRLFEAEGIAIEGEIAATINPAV